MRIFPSVFSSFVDDWYENRVNDYAERRERLVASWRKYTNNNRRFWPFVYIFNALFFGLLGLVEFLTQFVGIVIWEYVIKYLKFLFDHLVIIFVMIVVAGAMITFQTHLPGAASTYRESAVAGVETVNAVSNVGNAAFAAGEIVTPVNNFMMYSTVSMLIHIEDGATRAMGLGGVTARDAAETAPGAAGEDVASSRRMLQSATPDDRSSGEKFIETLINVLIVIGTVFLNIILIMIDVFFTYIYPGLEAIMGSVILVLRMVSCAMSGQLCGFLEILDAIVNLIWTPLAAVFGKIPIACGANQLTKVPCECAGYFWDFTPGIYRNLEPCGVPDNRYSWANFSEYEDSDGSGVTRRLLVSCRQNQDGDWIEQVGSTSISKSTDLAEACPVARRAFHPYTHAQDMQRFDTHDCITHCVAGVALMSCDGDASNHTVSLLGTCGDNAAEVVDESEARRRLAFLGTDVKLTKPAQPQQRRSLQEEGSLWSSGSRADRIAALRSLVPLRFSVEGVGECDMSLAPQGVYELLDTLRCVGGWMMKTNNKDAWTPWAPGGAAAARVLSDGAHRMRQLKHSVEVKDVKELYEPTDKVSIRHAMQWESRDRMRRRATKKPGPIRRRLQLVLPDDEATFAPSTSPTSYDDPNTDPVNPDDPVPCLGRVLCPDQVTCAVEAKYCAPPKEWSPVVAYSHYVQKFSSAVANFDAYAEISKAKKCYQDRTLSPYDASYVFKSREEKLRDTTTQFCLGEFGPTDYRLASVQYSPDADIQTFCSGSAEFEGCRCPDFWDSRGVTVQYVGIDSSGLYTLGNGVKWFLYVIWLLLNAVADFVDRLLESAGLPSFSGSANSGYGLTNQEFSKCVFLHTGDAAALVLFVILVWGFLKSTFGVADWFMTNWVNAFSVWACIPNPTSALERMQNLKYQSFQIMTEKFEEALRQRRLAYDAAKPDKSLAPIEIPFTPAEYKAALRFRKWLVAEKHFNERNVHFVNDDNKVVTARVLRRGGGSGSEHYRVAVDFEYHLFS